jgi:hypothetical protein
MKTSSGAHPTHINGYWRSLPTCASFKKVHKEKWVTVQINLAFMEKSHSD